MSWKIKYSAQALDDLKTVYEYIAFELLVPDTAKNQVNRIMQSINSLVEMPMMYRIYERVFPVDNYIVLYLPKEELKTVNIVRIIYGGRDVRKQLDEIKEI